MTVAVIIVAAGRGLRFGSAVPKQYYPLHDTTPIRLAMEAFLLVEEVRWIVPVIHPADHDLYAKALAGVDHGRILPAVEGGGTRAQSVRNGLEALVDQRPDRVLIHDAARPFVTVEIIQNVMSILNKCDGAFAALPVVDALWRIEESVAKYPISRDGLWRAQTPQGFRFELILEAHRSHNGTGADDVAVALEAGLNIELVLGSEQNYKITTLTDIARAHLDIERNPSWRK